MAELGALAQMPEANIIKLPNISASIPQMKACIEELQGEGFPIPEYPENPCNDVERSIRQRYDSVKGSAVNPVLREGNSDRRCSPAVKAYARANPHSMGAWEAESCSIVSSMESGDFFANEQSHTVDSAQSVRIELHTGDGAIHSLKESVSLQAGEVLDASFMSVKALRSFLREQIIASKESGLLFSLHMKATMMKVSDPIIFGHAVSVYFDTLLRSTQTRLLQWVLMSGMA